VTYGGDIVVGVSLLCRGVVVVGLSLLSLLMSGCRSGSWRERSLGVVLQMTRSAGLGFCAGSLTLLRPHHIQYNPDSELDGIFFQAEEIA
jgi:hypothetical protein